MTAPQPVLGAMYFGTRTVEETSFTLLDDLGVAGYTALQLRHSYLRPRPDAELDSGHLLLSDEAIDYVAADGGLALWVYTPLLNGSYTRADRPLPEVYDHPGTDRRLAALDEVAAELGATRNQVALAWLTGGAAPASPIVGVSSVAQLDEALDAVKLTDEQRVRLDGPS